MPVSAERLCTDTHSDTVCVWGFWAQGGWAEAVFKYCL